jgi:ATP-binding cassette subfamily B protein
VLLSRTTGTGPALVDRFTASSARLVDLNCARSSPALADGRHDRGVRAIPAVIYLAPGLFPAGMTSAR